jgi:hypothetical protein
VKIKQPAANVFFLSPLVRLSPGNTIVRAKFLPRSLGSFNTTIRLLEVSESTTTTTTPSSSSSICRLLGKTNFVAEALEPMHWRIEPTDLSILNFGTLPHSRTKMLSFDLVNPQECYVNLALCIQSKEKFMSESFRIFTIHQNATESFALSTPQPLGNKMVIHLAPKEKTRVYIHFQAIGYELQQELVEYKANLKLSTILDVQDESISLLGKETSLFFFFFF